MSTLFWLYSRRLAFPVLTLGPKPSRQLCENVEEQFEEKKRHAGDGGIFSSGSGHLRMMHFKGPFKLQQKWLSHSPKKEYKPHIFASVFFFWVWVMDVYYPGERLKLRSLSHFSHGSSANVSVVQTAPISNQIQLLHFIKNGKSNL